MGSSAETQRPGTGKPGGFVLREGPGRTGGDAGGAESRGSLSSPGSGLSAGPPGFHAGGRRTGVGPVPGILPQGTAARQAGLPDPGSVGGNAFTGRAHQSPF